jgi:hypothetical protein
MIKQTLKFSLSTLALCAAPGAQTLQTWKMSAEGFRAGVNSDKDTQKGGPYTLELK